MNTTKNMDYRIPIFKQMEEERKPIKGQEETWKKKTEKREIHGFSHSNNNNCFGLLVWRLTMYKNVYTVLINFLEYLSSGSTRYLASLDLKENMHITEKLDFILILNVLRGTCFGISPSACHSEEWLKISDSWNHFPAYLQCNHIP